MRVVLAALAALLLASPARGEIVYVPDDPPTTFDLGSYAVGADTIIFSRQYYGTTLTPSVDGTEERPKVWIGSGSGVTFAGIVPKSHNRFYNLTSTAGVDFPADGKHVMFDGCTIGGKLNFKDADSSSVRNCTVLGTSLKVNEGAGNMAQADTLEWTTFSGLSGESDFPIRFGITNAGVGYVDKFVRRFNTFTITQTGDSGWTPAKHFKTSNLLSYANRFTVTSDATAYASNEGNFGMVFRDSSYNLTMRRDVILINNEAASFSSYGLLSSSGMGGAYSSSLTGWAIDSCYIRVFRGDAVFFQAQHTGLRFRNNVVRSRLSTALSMGSAYAGGSNDPYIHHNTFMGKNAVYFAEADNNGGGFSNNLLWGTSTAACDAYQAVAGTTGNLTSFSDSNVVYSTTANSSRALCKTTCAAPGSGPWSTIYSNDTHSYWANPDFADTSWANLNVTPKTRFVTNSGGFLFQYAGASNGTGTTTPLGPATAAYWYGSDGYFVQPEERWLP